MGGGAVVLEERRVRVDFGPEPFAQDEFGPGELEPGVEFRARGALHAVIGPERLFAVAHVHLFERMLAGMGAGEGVMARRMPVLGENDVLEARRDAMNDRDDCVAVGHGKSPAGAEVILYVDDEEYVLMW